MDDTDPAKAATAMELLGRGGKDMIPLLKDGSAALREMMAEADTYGQVFTAGMGAQAEQFNDNLTKLGGAFTNIGVDLTERLLPYLTQFTDWLVENGPAIAEAITRLVELGAKFVPLGQAIAEGIKVGGDGIVAFVKTVDEAGFAAGRFVRDIPAKLDALREAVSAKMAEIAESFHGLVEKFVQIGRDLIDGLWRGIAEKIGGLKDKVAGIATSIENWFRGPLETHSPSRVFAEIGRATSCRACRTASRRPWARSRARCRASPPASPRPSPTC